MSDFQRGWRWKAPATPLSLPPSSSATLGVQTSAATPCFILDTFEADFYFPQGQDLEFLNYIFFPAGLGAWFYLSRPFETLFLSSSLLAIPALC